MLPISKERIGSGEPMIEQLCPVEARLSVGEMNILRPHDPDHVRTEYAPTPFWGWDLRVQVERDAADFDSNSCLAGCAIGNYLKELGPSTEMVSFMAYGSNEIRKRIDDSISGIPEDCRPSDELVEFFKISNIGAFANRIDKNGDINTNIKDMNMDDYNRLSLGTGRPSELVDIFDRHYGDLLSLELAKQTVGMRWNRTDVMDRAVLLATEDNGFLSEKSKERYYYTSGISAVEGQQSRERAGIYVRKQELGSKKVDGGRLVLMQRDSFMVDFHHSNMRNLLPGFNDWYSKSLSDEWVDNEGYEHFEPLDVSEDEIVEMIRANTKRTKPGNARGGSGLKTPIFGGNLGESACEFGEAVAAKIESAIADMVKSGQEFSPDLGVHMANRSYYVYFESEKD